MSELYDFEKDFDPNEFGDRETGDFYARLRESVRSYVSRHAGDGLAQLLLYLPDFFYMLVRLMGDARVPSSGKVQIGAAIAYFLSPVDLIPDLIPGLGWLDDLYLAVIVTDNLLGSVDPEVLLQYWMGDDDVIRIIKTTLGRLNQRFGMGFIEKLLRKAGISGSGRSGGGDAPAGGGDGGDA